MSGVFQPTRTQTGVSINAAVGQGGANRPDDVRVIQNLLNANAGLMQPFARLDVDGLIGPNTIAAIKQFQQRVVGMGNPDGRVDPNKTTHQKLIAALNQPTKPGPVVPPTPNVPVGLITVTFAHGDKIPTKTNYKPAVAATAGGMYESTITVSGSVNGTFSGSIYPDDMMVKGRIKDGTYPLHIGFHKGGGAAKQDAKNLVVKTEGIRAGLLVNARNSVPVISMNSSKTTSVGINIHNGFNSSRGSDGCLTIMPGDWSRFISLFLNAFPKIEDWHAVGTNTGKKIGEVIVKA